MGCRAGDDWLSRGQSILVKGQPSKDPACKIGKNKK